VIRGGLPSITVLFLQFLDLLHWVISPNSSWLFLVSNLYSLLPQILLFILFVLVAFLRLPQIPVSFFPFRRSSRPFIFFMNFFFLFLSFSHVTGRSQVTTSWVHESHIAGYLDRKLTITKRGTARNLIVCMIEAFDLKSLKSDNRNGNSYVPLIDRLAKRGTIAVNLRPQPYTTTRLSAIFASQCGLPMVSRRFPVPSEKVMNSSKVKCVSDFLAEVGYQVYTAYSGTDGRLAAFLSRHGHRILDEAVHFQGSNRDLIHWFRRRAFRELLTQVQPFALFLLLRNRPPFEVECRSRFSTDYQRYYRALDCLDTSVGDFLRTMRWHSVSADVVLMGLTPAVFEFHPAESQLLPFVVLSRTDGEVARNASLFDVPPTLLDLVGLEAEPRFPFGGSLFADLVYRLPGKREFARLLRELGGGKGNVSCFGEADFCGHASFATDGLDDYFSFHGLEAMRQ
jgi:hypothetical protein